MFNFNFILLVNLKLANNGMHFVIILYKSINLALQLWKEKSVNEPMECNLQIVLYVSANLAR